MSNFTKYCSNWNGKWRLVIRWRETTKTALKDSSVCLWWASVGFIIILNLIKYTCKCSHTHTHTLIFDVNKWHWVSTRVGVNTWTAMGAERQSDQLNPDLRFYRWTDRVEGRVKRCSWSSGGSVEGGPHSQPALSHHVLPPTLPARLPGPHHELWGAKLLAGQQDFHTRS